MVKHDLLSRNPAGSGGVGRSKILVNRQIGPCNCLAMNTCSDASGECATEQQIAEAGKRLGTAFDKAEGAISALNNCSASGDCATEQEVAEVRKKLELEFSKAESAISALNNCSASGDCATEQEVAEVRKKLELEFSKAESAISALNNYGT